MHEFIQQYCIPNNNNNNNNNNGIADKTYRNNFH